MGGKTSAKSKNTWISKTYDRINLTVAKGKKDTIQTHAEAQGESVNGFINRAIDETMERDGAGGPQEALGEPVDELTTSVQNVPKGTLKAAQEAARAAGEATPQFIARAVRAQAERDQADRGPKV